MPGEISAGLAVKYISSQLDTANASSLACDLGLQKTLPWWDQRITLGVSAQNLGGSLKYLTEAVAIGSTLDAGVAVRRFFLEYLTLAVDYRMLMNASWNSANVGLEYGFYNESEIGFLPRLGYESGSSVMTAGFGVEWRGYQLDYAFMSQSDLGNNNRLSLSIKF